MAIVAKDEGGNFTPAPEGQFAAVCVDVVDLGIVESTFDGQIKRQHKIRIAWQLGEADMDTGKPFLVTRQFTLSLNEKAALRTFLESWRGKAFTDVEVKQGFDVEKLIGAQAVVQILHAERNGKVYGNVNAIMKPMKGMAAIQPRDYVRVQDRPQQPANGQGRPQGAPLTQDGALRREAPSTVHHVPQPGRVEHVVQAAASMPDPYVANVQRAVPALADGPDDLPF